MLMKSKTLDALHEVDMATRETGITFEPTTQHSEYSVQRHQRVDVERR